MTFQVFDDEDSAIYISVSRFVLKQGDPYESLYQPVIFMEDFMEDTIRKLEQRVADMIQLCEEMGRENELLRADQQLLRQEFKVLQEKNKIARGRIEQIVARLKSL